MEYGLSCVGTVANWWCIMALKKGLSWPLVDCNHLFHAHFKKHLTSDFFYWCKKKANYCYNLNHQITRPRIIQPAILVRSLHYGRVNNGGDKKGTKNRFCQHGKPNPENLCGKVDFKHVQFTYPSFPETIIVMPKTQFKGKIVI